LSFLAPLFAIGLAAVAVPILLHLLRRKPQQRLPFSSLIFLDESPPTLTRRNRIDDWWLLLIRMAVIAMIVLAFMRPFWNNRETTTRASVATARVLLLDTSASLRAGDRWTQSLAKAREVIDASDPADLISLVTFDSQLKTLFSFEQSQQTPAALRGEQLTSLVNQLEPSWNPTHLDTVLTSAAESLLDFEIQSADGTPGSAPSSIQKEIVLISDLQSGADLEGLAGTSWPESIRLRAIVIQPPSDSKESNSSLWFAGNSTEENLDTDRTQTEDLSVRLSTTEDSPPHTVEIRWTDPSGEFQPDLKTQFRQTPGLSRVIRLPDSTRSTRIEISGDDVTFDNTFHLAPAAFQEQSIQILESASPPSNPDDESPFTLGQFVQQIDFGDASRRVTVERGNEATDWSTSDPRQTPLWILSARQADWPIEASQTFLAAGGTILMVLDSPVETINAAWLEDSIRQLSSDAELELEAASQAAADAGEYALLGQIDFSSPLLSVFDNSKYNDFTKIRFWQHRQIFASDAWRVLARFDDNSPALLEKKVGEGTVILLTSGWQTDQSQLALSSKFVPLLFQLYDRAAPRQLLNSQMVTGQSLSPETFNLDLGTEAALTTPDGSTQTIVSGTSIAIDQPGLYRVTDGDREQTFAANIPYRESETTPGSLATLEEIGLPLSQTVVPPTREAERALAGREIEQSQKWWRWCLGLAIGLLCIEAIVAWSRPSPVALASE
jgi:hypothetical protein